MCGEWGSSQNCRELFSKEDGRDWKQDTVRSLSQRTNYTLHPGTWTFPPTLLLLIPVPVLKFCFSTVRPGPHVELVVRGSNATSGG